MYVPILKSKTAEMDALGALAPEVTKNTRPLIEFLSTSNGDTDAAGVEDIEKTVNKLWRAWESEPFYADFSLLGEKFEQVLSLLIGRMNEMHMHPTLVLSGFVFTQPAMLGAALGVVDTYKLEKVCLRLSPDAFERKNYVNYISSLIYIIRRQSKNIAVDLLLDFSNVLREAVYERCVRRFIEFANTPPIDELIVAGGVFPQDMSEFSTDNPDNKKERTEWVLWQKYCANNGITSYGDYTIRHPIYNPETAHYLSSATIKYACGDVWKIYRGEKGKFEQYIANAQILIGDEDVFYGKNYCAGDAFIYEKSTHTDYSKPGNTMQWLDACINHHMTVVHHQLMELSGDE